MNTNVVLRRFVVAAALLMTAANVAAQPAAQPAAPAYPSRVVRIVLTYPPGGAATVVARTYADRLSHDFGQSVIVDSRPGGNTTIGTEAVAKASPDGYTLLVTSTALVVVHWLSTNLGYDTLKDLTGVATLVRNDHMIAVNLALPVTSLKELVAYARRYPGKLNAYTSGIGTNNHLENLLLMQAAGIKFTVVPYKGGGAALSDLLSGTLHMILNSPALFTPYIKSGKIRGIAISGDKRNAALPEVPTFAEAGLPGFSANTWYSLLAPAATPRAIVERLNGQVNRIQAGKEVQDVLARLGIDVFPNSVAGTNAFIRAELESFGKVIKDNNIQAGAEE